jgi:hypothetical protein
VTNNTLLAREFNDLLIKKYDLVPTEELAFDLEVIIEIADALLHRAFIYDKQGDDRFIAKLRTTVREIMEPHRTLP